jgi:hypothetical protein
MGDNFTPPKVEKRQNAVTAQVEAEQQNTQENETRVVNGPVDIYKNGIDDFVKFLKGEIAAGTLEERRNQQKSVIKTCWGMLEMDYAQCKEALDYFLITVGKNQNAFEWNNVLAPLSTLEGLINASELVRYKRFIMFITLLSEHARSRDTFTQMFDMTKFTAMFATKAAQNLHNYVHR